LTGNVVTFDSSGALIEATKPLTILLAYYRNGKPLDPEKDGTLLVAIVGDEDLITQGRLWVKFVIKIEILPALPVENLHP